jgi:hypothetical protein
MAFSHLITRNQEKTVVLGTVVCDGNPGGTPIPAISPRSLISSASANGKLDPEEISAFQVNH